MSSSVRALPITIEKQRLDTCMFENEHRITHKHFHTNIDHYHIIYLKPG